MKTKYTKCTPEILAKYLENIIKHGNVLMAAYLTNVGEFDSGRPACRYFEQTKK